MPRPPKGDPPEPPEGFVWSDEAARRMSITRKTLWNYRHLGKGPKPKPYRRRLIYSIAEINAYNKAEMESSDSDETATAYDSRPPEPRLAA